MMSNAPRTQASIHALKLAKQGQWLLLLMIGMAMGIDFMLSAQGFVARGVTAGAVLSFVMHWAFTQLSFRRGQGHGKAMMQDMTLALITKWLIGFLGFALIFSFAERLSVAAVFLGFFAMQGGFFYLLLKVGKVG